MSLRHLPELKAGRLPDICAWQPDATAIDRWNAGLVSAEQTPANTITVLDVIGDDPWSGGGVTSKRVAGALRAIGDEPVYVDINSPGGDFFEGVAIYNMLRQHSARVTVRVLGLAASAASVVAMAGDDVQIGKAGFMMVHNAWVVAIGNRHDLLQAAETIEPFDDAMAAVYADRAGVERNQAAAWMDAEKWFSGEQAVDAGLADGLLPDDAVGEDTAQARRVEASKPILKAEMGLRKAGMSRSESRSLLGDVMGAHAVAAQPTQAVAGELTASLEGLLKTIRS